MSRKKRSSGSAELVREFDQLRETVREFFIFGDKDKETVGKGRKDIGASRTVYVKINILKHLLNKYSGESENRNGSLKRYIIEPERDRKGVGSYIARNNRGTVQPFIHINSRTENHNPFFYIWKANEISSGRAFDYFAFIEVLETSGPLPFSRDMSSDENSLYGIASTYYNVNDEAAKDDLPDLRSYKTVQSSFEQLVKQGCFIQKAGKKVYTLGDIPHGITDDLLDFFSEVSPCGVIGSFISDKLEDGIPIEDLPEDIDCFRFKHHYLAQTLDSEIMCSLLLAMHGKRSVTIHYKEPREPHADHQGGLQTIVPLQIMTLVQTGRQYIICYLTDKEIFSISRLDDIKEVKSGSKYRKFDILRSQLKEKEQHMWGASYNINKSELEHVEFTIKYDENDKNDIHLRRLFREKRCGHVSISDGGYATFTANVYDSKEMIPWIRTFIGLITDLHFSNHSVQKRFENSLERMYEEYDI